MQAAVLQKLITIGEAASRLGDDLRGRYPYIPWRQIRAFRNIAVHNYAGVDYVLVWHAAKSDSPTLRAQVQEVLATEETP